MLHNLKPAKGSVKSKRRIARGEGSGSGDTAGKGHKGQKARTGAKSKKGFEGGQTPLQRRLPKRGFKNINSVEYTVLNLSNLQLLSEKHNLTDFSIEVMLKKGFIKANNPLKILANGELKTAINVTAHKFSAKAKAMIEAKGGTTNEIQ